MTASTVSWRQVVGAVLAVLGALVTLMVIVRADGLPAVDAASARATGWFVHQPTGRITLVDGYGGRALASLDTGAQGEQLTVAEGRSGAYLLNDNTAEAQAIDSAELRLGTPFGLAALGAGRAISSVGQAGLVVVDPVGGDANVVPVDDEPVSFTVDAGSATQIAPNGSIWSIVGAELVRTTSSATERTQLDAPGAELSLVGNDPLILDAPNRRARLGSGGWQPLPTTADPSEILIQAPGPSSECGWVGAGDDLWCISSEGLVESATIDGLDLDGSDLLAISGDAAIVVRRGPSSIARFDWRNKVIIDELPASIASDAVLAVTATVELVWVDDVAGDFVWGVSPWGVAAIDKNAQGVLVLGEDGEIVDEGQASGGAPGAAESEASEPEEREPDDNGIDDPPIAVDDLVTARSGSSVPVQVTSNDYDPDGEAIAVSAVGSPGHGSVEIGTASTVVYTPDTGYVGRDSFEYTIVDGNGTPATATVFVELLVPGSTNQPPLGVSDAVETGPGVPVIVDVLLNDVDPERDALRLGGFSPPAGIGGSSIGEVTETVGASGLSALRFAPVEGFEGTAVFSYRPVDAFDAVGDDVEVRVEVARRGDPNRPPVVRPDALRVRRNIETPIPVLVNDADPDGDVLVLRVVEPLPAGLEVAVEGEQLSVVARAGSASFAPFEYEVDDGNGHVVRGSVLVSVIDDIEPNRPPVVSADTAKVVVGRSIVVDVVANDIDPDGDPLSVVSVTQPDDRSGQVVVFSDREIQFSPAPISDEEAQANARFTYTVTDGRGNEAVGEVTITVLPEPLDEPPFARDDSTFTFVDVPVTIDVLRNDGDPSGARPTIVGRPGCPGGGLATVTADGQVRYDPPTGLSGAFRCTYEVGNDQGLRASAAIIVSVREPLLTNRAPETVNDTLTVAVGESASINVVANDSDPDGPSAQLTLVSSTAPTLGTAIRSGNLITFVAGQATGTTTINYQVADVEGAVSLGFLRVRITERVEVAPIAVPDTQSIFGPGVPTQFSVLANDSDPDQTPGGLSVVSAARVSGSGTVSLSADVVTITPDPNFVGQVIGTYTIRDGSGLTATATVTLTIAPPLNRPPDARDDTADVVNGGTVSVPVLFNDSDPDGDRLSLTIVSSPDGALGEASSSSDRITFVANPGASGTAVIGYQVSDGELTDNAVLRVTVRPCTTSTPVANDGFLRTGYQQPIAVDLAAFGSGGTIVDVVGPPGYADNVYTPPAGENGNVTIRYAVVNSCRLRAAGSITIDVNQVPVSSPVSVEILRTDTAVVPVSSLASDGEALTITSSSGAPAWVTTGPSELVLATDASVAPGEYTWTSRVADPGGLEASVSVTAIVRNRGPVAVADTVDVSTGPATVSLVANDTDPDGPASALRIASLSSGTITFDNGATGTVTVEPDEQQVRIAPTGGKGTATFTYTVRDADGAVSAPVTVTVIGPRNNRDPLADDQTVELVTNTSRAVALAVSDPDGDPLTVVDVDDPAGLVEGVTGTTMQILATAPGTYTVTYRVTDGELFSRTATLTVIAADPPPPSTTTTTSP